MKPQFIEKKSSFRSKLKLSIYQFFTDHFMIVLAFMLVPITLLPFIFTFSQFMLTLFDIINYIIIGIFVIEYFLKLYVADSRKAYITNLWHIIDLLIVVLAIIDLIPWIPLSGFGKTTPMLRLLRITRAFAMAGRTVKRAVPQKQTPKPLPKVSNMKINIFENGKIIKEATKKDISNYLATPSGTWIEFQEVSEIDIDFISNVLKIPKIVIESKAIRESYPRIDFFKDFTTIFIRDSKLQSVGIGIKDITILKNNMLIICSNNYIATISGGKSSLFDRITSEGLSIKDEEFIIGLLYSIFKTKIRDYEEIVRMLEQKTSDMEELPVGMARPSFLEETFQLKKEIQKIHGNLWHFKKVLDATKTNKITLRGLKEEHLSLFDILYDESVYLFETSENVKDNLISLIELHINTVSFGLNKVMRILAVITCLALIPSIISGLLGENLIDTPYPVTIFEIFFLVISMMTLAAYAFYKNGWFR